MKRMTKAQKEAAQKAALLQRVTDVYSGATGGEWLHDECFIDAAQLCRVMTCLRDLFTSTDREWMFGIHVLDKFLSAESATEFLYREGVRA
jgi:hypothetical protein